MGRSLTLVVACVAFVGAAAAVVVRTGNTGRDEKTNAAPVDGVVARGNAKFALDLFHGLRTTPGNVVFGPWSLYSVLAMTRAGARGETADQMTAVLHFPDEGALHAGMAEAIKRLTAPSPEYELTVSNALWPQTGFAMAEPFTKMLHDSYGAAVEALDYEHDAEGARGTINTKVKEQTRDKIEELIGPGVLTNRTRLVLTNAVYFKGKWEFAFDPTHTRDEPFTAAKDSVETVPMMHLTRTLRYAEDDTAQVLELPYKGGALSMVIVLPRAIDGLPTLEAELTANKLDVWMSRLSAQEVEAALPKFRMTFGLRADEHLKSMGMTLPFDEAKADFSGIAGKPGDLHISAVLHKAFIDVNEEGTEAAAASAAVIEVRSSVVRRPVFRADHPFLFLLVETATRNILFLGRVANPKA